MEWQQLLLQTKSESSEAWNCSDVAGYNTGGAQHGIPTTCGTIRVWRSRLSDHTSQVCKNCKVTYKTFLGLCIKSYYCFSHLCSLYSCHVNTNGMQFRKMKWLLVAWCSYELQWMSVNQLMTSVHRIQDTVWYHGMSYTLAAWCSNNTCYDVFKNFSLLQEQILTCCMFRILLEASKTATDLFEIKLCTCEGLVCLLTFLWHCKNHEILTHT
jgi:hypothetical protein